ncbi:MAG TPA: hypothetical protein VJA21_07610 [Verrucomicrobiae bacterium]
MDWEEEPATQQQLCRLQGYGFVPACALTVTQAARLIRQFSKHPRQSGAADQRNQQAFAAPPKLPPLPRQEDVSESAKMHAHRLRLAVGASRRQMEANPDGPNVRADYYASISARRDFWHDTCREQRDMLIGSVQVLELHQEFGVHFFSPTGEEVQELLDALDHALPTWERDHPELFYQTLRLNFPSLARQR